MLHASIKICFSIFFIRLCDYLGTGHFATVYKGQWESSAGPKDVAIKVLKSEKNNEMKIKFLKEAAIMGQFLHPNVVKLYGLALNNSEVCFNRNKIIEMQLYLVDICICMCYV